jgi:hypothetical protein
MDSLVGASALLRLASDMDPPALDPDCAMGVHCLLLSAKQGFDRFVMGLPKELRFDHPLQGPAFLTPLCQALRIAERASRDECPKSGGLDFGEIELLRELVERVQGEASKFDVPRQ